MGCENFVESDMSLKRLSETPAHWYLACTLNRCYVGVFPKKAIVTDSLAELREKRSLIKVTSVKNDSPTPSVIAHVRPERATQRIYRL
jgi:hypothetical protein